jgi:hypothetical protein
MKNALFPYLGVVIIGFSLMGMSRGRTNRNVQNSIPNPETHATTFPTPCPTAVTGTVIDKWRTSVISSFGTSLGEAAVAAWVNSCFPPPAQVPVCISNLSKYLKRNQGENIIDADLHSDAHRRLPDELLVSGSADYNYVFRGDIEQHAKDLGWPVARYKSRHSGGFDSETSSLLMIEVPGSKMNPPVNFDRYINISLQKDDHEDGTNPTPQKNFPDPDTLAAAPDNSYPHITTMVTVERGTRTSKAHLYFQMFARSGNIYKPRTPLNPSGCVSCHPSGLRAISPLGYHVRAGETQLNPDNWMQVKKLGMDMAAGQVGGITWGGKNDANGNFIPTLETDSSGPVIGASEPFTQNTRTKEFIVGANGTSGCQKFRKTVYVTDIFGRPPGKKNIYAFTSSPPVDWQKVSDAMDCQMCHNNERQGVLNSRTSSGQIDFKILVDQSMPFGMHKNPLDQGTDPTVPVVDQLNPNERIALANCLQVEWNLERTKLRDWLTVDSCTEDSSKNVKRGAQSRLPANQKSK